MAFAVSGCVGKAALEPAPETAVEVPAAVEAVAAPPPPPDPLAPACIALLERLDATQPLLAGVEESLASQADRFDAAIAGLSRPAPEPSALVCPPSVNASLGGKEIIGAIEWLFMEPPGRHFRARVDSGSETSSLSASDLVEFERDGDDWVRFTFSHDSAEDTVEFELPVKRTVLIRQASSAATERRLVVELDIRLGKQLQTTEFTLTDRSSMTYPILLGRTFLMDLYIVDVARSYTHERYDAS